MDHFKSFWEELFKEIRSSATTLGESSIVLLSVEIGIPSQYLVVLGKDILNYASKKIDPITDPCGSPKFASSHTL